MIGLGVVISRAVIQPLDTIKDVMKKVAQGDLTAQIPVLGKDELGIVASASITVLRRT